MLRKNRSDRKQARREDALARQKEFDSEVQACLKDPDRTSSDNVMKKVAQIQAAK